MISVKKIAIKMNNFLSTLKKPKNFKSSKKLITKNLKIIVSEFDDHLSIKNFKKFFSNVNVNHLNFKTITMEEVKKKINLNIRKSYISGSFPANYYVIKEVTFQLN